VLPQEDLVYLGDTARALQPESPSTVIRFACDAQFLLQRNVKAVVVACNCSAWALPMLEKKFKVPIFGVIVPGVQAALGQTRNQRIGVIGTSATIRSRAYSNAILAFGGVKVFTQACPLLVPLVEEGWLNHPVTAAVLNTRCGPSHRHVGLGCHYPLLKRRSRRWPGRK
jgi:glutamate racemase